MDASPVDAGTLDAVPSVVDAAPDAAPDAAADAGLDARDAAEGGSATTGTPSDAADAARDTAADAGRIWASCMEHVPEGAARPELENTFPDRGKAGYALALRVRVEHGLGETVLPNGFRIQRDSDAARAIASAGFELPVPDAGAGPSLKRQELPDKAVTEVVINFVALPEKPGRHTLTLPPIPIALSRASGELVTLCTTPHAIVIDEPIANETEPAPKDNPPPRPQREIWTLARDLTYGALLGIALAALVAWLVVLWRRRPKPPKPPPPPRPPWELALEALEDLRREDLVSQGRQAEHIDRVSDVVRLYLGRRFGFDGIESTTDEVLQVLRRMTPPLPVYDEVRQLLQDSDLVKFARWTPTDTDCRDVLTAAEHIVGATMPAQRPEPAHDSAETTESVGKEGSA